MSIAMIIKIIIFIGYVVYLINNKKSKQKTKYKNNNYVNEYSQSNTKNIGKKECNTQYYKDVNKYKIITDCLSRIIDKLSYDYDPNITLGEILKLEESNILMKEIIECLKQKVLILLNIFLLVKQILPMAL